ncbi:MAG: hypothetical protein AAF570_27840, partial [Bacteroidota bacterium]
MKKLYTTLTLLLITATLTMTVATEVVASNPKKKLRRFLPKRAVPAKVELLIGGHGEFSKRYGRQDNFNPYGDFQIGFRVTTHDNKVYGTQGIGGGIFSWKNMNVEIIGGRFENNLVRWGRVSIPSPHDVPGHKVRVRVSLKSMPDLYQEFEIPIDFAYSSTLRQNGMCGPDGFEADCRAPQGPAGRSHEKCDGEDGRDGRKGMPGGLGEHGAAGPDIEVRLFPFDDLNSDDVVIEAHEINLLTGQMRKRWFTPGKSTLTIISRGGQGGDGGDGQDGGRGGDGGDGGREGTEDRKGIGAHGGHGGFGGAGGCGGDGGMGGPGGQIRV